MGVNCIEAGERLSPFLDGELNREEETRLLEHLKGCPLCAREWDEIKRVAAALRTLGQKEMAAPSDLSSAVMARIKEADGSKYRYRHLKQGAAGAAAVLLLAFGAALIKPEPSSRVAQLPAPIESANGLQAGGVNPGLTSNMGEAADMQDQANTSPSENSSPTSGKTGANNDNNRSAAVYRSPNTIEFTGDKEYIIVSTFLKVRVVDSAEAEKTVDQLVRGRGAQIQSLGQQTLNGKMCLVEKIVVSGADAQNLTASLAALGTLISQDEQKADLTQRYSELYDKYITLKSEQAQTRNENQAAQLEKQIKEAEEQLRAWEQQAGTQTIVLWLQQ